MGFQRLILSLLNFHSQLLFTFFLMKHLKARSGVWLNFAEVTVEGVKKAQCNFCPFQTVPNATGVEKHMTVSRACNVI